MEITFEITSTCSGIVERVYPRESSYVHEREVVCRVRKEDGTVVGLYSQFGGTLSSLHIAEGYKVTPDMVVATLKEKISAIGLSSD